MMTFEQWQATRRQVDRLQDHVETGGIELPGYLYEPGHIYECGPDRLWLHIENCEWVGSDLGELERLLWQRWASHEIAARGPKP
jgi:hypothetical protein